MLCLYVMLHGHFTWKRGSGWSGAGGSLCSQVCDVGQKSAGLSLSFKCIQVPHAQPSFGTPAAPRVPVPVCVRGLGFAASGCCSTEACALPVWWLCPVPSRGLHSLQEPAACPARGGGGPPASLSHPSSPDHLRAGSSS